MTLPVAEEILLMRLFAVSATYTNPAASIEMPEGELKLAFVPAPSEYPDVPLPASVVTDRDEIVIIRIM